MCSVARGENGAAIIESLLARHWIPRETQIQWTGATREELHLDTGLDWNIVSVLPQRPCGAMILKLSASDSSGLVRSVTVSGNARVFVNCLVAERNVPKGTRITPDVAADKYIEWKASYGDPLTGDVIDTNVSAARTIGGGRPICRDDIDSPESIQSGARVMIRVSQGAVDVTVPGRALGRGDIGEQISAMTLLQPPRTFRGTVESKGIIHVELP